MASASRAILALLAASAARPVAASLQTWMSDITWGTIWRDMTLTTTAEEELQFAVLKEFKGLKFTWKPEPLETHWSRFVVSLPTWTGQNWHIPLAAVAAYFVAIPLLRRLVAAKGKWNVRTFAFYWNVGLSIFSGCGVVACVPVLLDSWREHGLYFTTCAPAAWYGGGLCGVFVALFVYSKVAELIDTILLLLANKPVIALQWWHHSTVLLYCWHSYTIRIASGLWFASMNYSVHFVMYGYFALMSTKYRKYVTPYAIFITLAQLAQMLVGMFVTIKAMMYQDAGLECHVNKTNSVLGCTMYFSYFVLFFKLFVENYVTQSRKRPAAVEGKVVARSLSEVARSVSRKITKQIVPQMDDEEEIEIEGDVCEGTKKIN